MSSPGTLERTTTEKAHCELGSDLKIVGFLGGYAASAGEPRRSVVALARDDGSVLVLDRDASTRGDARVVAVMAPDEPLDNAVVVSDMYLSDTSRGRCRLLSSDDLKTTESEEPPRPIGAGRAAAERLLDAEGRCYEIRACPSEASIDHLRWTRSDPQDPTSPPELLTVRDVIGSLESYEPTRAMTVRAVEPACVPEGVSSHRLRSELERLEASRLVLNRGLREAVAQRVAQGLTLSEIATRCGRTKRSEKGTVSGETSWLSRRIGVMAEAGSDTPTRWLHSDTLALIARRGLDLAPLEVEL